MFKDLKVTEINILLSLNKSKIRFLKLVDPLRFLVFTLKLNRSVAKTKNQPQEHHLPNTAAISMLQQVQMGFAFRERI